MEEHNARTGSLDGVHRALAAVHLAPTGVLALRGRMSAASSPAKKPKQEPDPNKQHVCFFCNVRKTCTTQLSCWALEAALRDRVPCHGADGLATAADRDV